MSQFLKKYTEKQISSFSAQYQTKHPQPSFPLSFFSVPTSQSLHSGHLFGLIWHQFLSQRNSHHAANLAFLWSSKPLLSRYQAWKFFWEKHQSFLQISASKLEKYLLSQTLKKSKANKKTLSSFWGNQSDFFSYSEAFDSYLQERLLELQARGKLIKTPAIAYHSFELQTRIPLKDIIWKTEKKVCYEVTYFVDTKNYSLHIPVLEPDFIFGDVALLVHPKDKRYKKLIGKQVLIPIVNRKIPILADESINTTKDNGIKRVTPCEDAESILLARKHQLPLDHEVLDEKGNYTSYAGEFFSGKSRKEFSKNVLQTLRDFRNWVPSAEMLEVEVAVPYYRFGNLALTPCLSQQLYLDVKEEKVLLQAALERWELFPDKKEELLALLPDITLEYEDQHSAFFLPFLISQGKHISRSCICEEGNLREVLEHLLVQQLLLGAPLYQEVLCYPSALNHKGERISYTTLDTADFLDLMRQFGNEAVILSTLVQKNQELSSLWMYKRFLYQLRNGVRYFYQHKPEHYTWESACSVLQASGKESDQRILYEVYDLFEKYRGIKDPQLMLSFFPEFQLMIQKKVLSWYLEVQKIQNNPAGLATLYLVFSLIFTLLEPLIPQYVQALRFLARIDAPLGQMPEEIRKRSAPEVLIYDLFDQLGSFKHTLEIPKHQHIKLMLKADKYSLEIAERYQDVLKELFHIDLIEKQRMHEAHPEEYTTMTFWTITLGIQSVKPEIADTPLSELSSALLLADLEDEYQKLLEKREIIKMIILNATNAGLADTPAIISRKDELHTLEERITRCYEKLSLYRSVHG